MFKFSTVLALILSLLFVSSAFAYSTTVTGNSFGDSNMIMIDRANASFWDRAESGGASDLKSGSFVISSDYGNTGVVETGIMFNWNGFANANGVNPYAEALIDFKITDRATGNVAFSFYYNPVAQDDSGAWAFANAMSGPFPPDIPQTFRLGTVYDWSLIVAVNARATGQDDGIGGYFMPDLGGTAGADATISFRSIDAPAATPIPGAVWLLGSGLVGLVGIRRKMKV